LTLELALLCESLMKVQETRKHRGIVFQEISLKKRFCGAEGLENVINLSDFNSGIW
jgi:peroxiredoxin